MLHYTRRGTGPRSTILLHGFLGSGRNLGTIARLIVERDPSRSIVLPDLRGHGSSPPLPPDADLNVLAADVLELARELSLAAPFALIGHSLGGRVALAAANIAPSSGGEVVLLDSSPGELADEAAAEIDEVTRALLAAPEEAATREELGEALRRSGLSAGLTAWLLMNLEQRGDRWGWRIDRRALAELLPRTREPDLWPVVDFLANRLTLIRGSRSSFVSDQAAARVLAAGGRVETLEGAGHFLHVDRPKDLANMLTGSGISSK